ncbi:glutamate synthase-related protein [Streptomyces sp. WM6386]|uniref:glutamate synthase-related protein n=1 Tax=Streptomyces sp. WM6386 TaxID=1415558 RepID=UPI0006194369|nr:glutamate synthase-related protein [Streptomyces sp. WM6386]KKD09133.1 GltA [Streptomyces sp. WM6386]
MNHRTFGLYDPALDHSDCGVGFITRLDGTPSHDVIRKGDEALRTIPHRGGKSAEGVGDGAGVNVDLSVEFFGAITGEELRAGHFGVANCFVPVDGERRAAAVDLVGRSIAEQGFDVLLVRDVPVDHTVACPAAEQYQLPVVQWVFRAPESWEREDVDSAAHRALLAVEAVAYADATTYAGLYVLSLSARTQVLKGRLNSGEVIGYFRDLVDPRHSVRSLYFHTRFSTNTEPHPTMAQPFRLMAHNGELNTDRKNRLSDEALARARTRSIVRPPGQSDSSRLDQTLQSRVFDDGLDLVEAVVSLMPPAWENDRTLPAATRDMLEYFSLYEEKNDGPAALIFSDGDVVGARLDRLGLRPLRTVETAEYLMVASEAGQVAFPDDEVVHRGRIEAGGMLVVDHRTGRRLRTREVLDALAARRPYSDLLTSARVNLDDLPAPDYYRGTTTLGYDGDLTLAGRYVAYSLNQESFRFMLDPMLADGSERISAMGYGNAINALSDTEGGMAKYFSQRFAQVTNPPLDSIREADGMSMRVALGPKPDGTHSGGRQLVVSSPVLGHLDMVRLRDQRIVPLKRFAMLYEPMAGDETANADALRTALRRLCDDVERFASEQGGIALLTDRAVSSTRAPLPVILAVAAVNQRLIETGLRLRVSLVAESGQLASSHHVATALGFGASAVYSLSARLRAEEKFPSAPAPAGEITATDRALAKFRKAAEKSLAKTMGRVGLCTAESYIGGEFFEPNYLDTRDDVFARTFPHMDAPVGGVGFARIAQAATDWHERARTVQGEQQIPLLGLFKERSDGAGHSFGVTAVRGFGDMVEERPEFGKPEDSDALRLLTLGQLDDAFGITDAAYRNTGYDALSDAEIDAFRITPGYRAFLRTTHEERSRRPAALRDVLALPADVTGLRTAEDFARELGRFSTDGNASVTVRGVAVSRTEQGTFRLRLAAPDLDRHTALAEGLAHLGEAETLTMGADGIEVTAAGGAARLLALLDSDSAPASVPLDEVQPAHEITRSLASGAMSHGALVATAHEAVAHGTNMVGGMSNSGEGGEHHTRYGTIRGSRIKQFASGRFGIWAGYLADPMLEELEIKIGQGAKPGEGGQLPAPKVTVDIAAARGGTPGIELISPPPHHDTYSIEDLAQLIHDCKAARVRVIVKLVSSEGIGTIAVGVAKAGADVINVAGNTGGTGAAAVTSLKYAGRSAEIGVAEVHQALLANGLRQKVVLRCSGAHQTGGDVVTSALLGADSFEFGTTALMMLGCVMAKNCNVKCPAGLTTNPEVFEGDPRALAQYLLNIAHDVRQILARLGLCSLREARGRTDLLQLLDHPASVGRLDVRRLLASVPEKIVADPEYLEKDFTTDDALIERVRAALLDRREPSLLVEGVHLGNSDKSVGGQLSIDIERLLNHESVSDVPAVTTDDRGRRRLVDDAVRIRTTGSAGQSYGVFCNDGITLEHTGTANDGVGKSQSGGRIIVRAPGGGSAERGGNVLIGNFALFGATGGRTFVQGEAGDRFAVRNSGATAVVEGVGDFGCEYMTGGTVLNLGGFGKGLGNGMSGGFLYQYDPSGELAGRVSADSLLVFPVTDTERGAFHEEAVRLLLAWHVEATGSELAARLLHDWDSERQHVYCGMPRALLLYQDSTEILAAATRSQLLDELATSIATDKLRAFKVDYRDRRTVLDGRAPAFGDQGSDDMFSLLSSYTVLGVAQDLALQRVPGASGPEDPRIAEAVRNLVLTEDFFVKQRVVKYLRGTLDRFDDGELATLIAIKRLDDYKRALKQRNNLSVDAPGTYGWIIHQTTKNAGRVRAARFDELLANAALTDLAVIASRRAPQAPTEAVTA